MKKILIALTLFTTIVLTSCFTANTPNDPIPAHTTFTISSNILKDDRVINIWTPNGYDSMNDALPVIYMADGGVKEDFPHVANTLKKLIEEKKIPAAILVGIENTERRRDLTGPSEVEKDKAVAPVIGGSANFRTFIKEELFPKIEEKYKITNEKTIIGESVAGLFVLETFFKDPSMFDNYIAFDPSLWWNNAELVANASTRLSDTTIKNKRIWFAGSAATDIQPHTLALSNTFKNTPNNIQWHYADEPGEQHHTIFRAKKEDALIWTLNK